MPELNRGASTDTRGYFTLTGLPGGKNYELIISYLGYKTESLKVLVQNNRITDFEIFLKRKLLELETIEKIGFKEVTPNATDISLDRITIQEVERHPRGVETDVFRSLQYLPGVQSVGDVSARYYVRGGASNQNLVLLDGVTIYNPFHALGIFSVIDPEMINSMEFYKGGFPSENGGRLSSVLKIFTKDGNRFNYGGSASLSMLTYKAMVEGPIPNGSFILTGRKSHSQKILNKFINNKKAPFDFYDISFRVNYQNVDPEFIDDSKFTVHGFFSKDQLLNNDPLKEDYKWTNNILGFKRFQIYDSPLHSELSIYQSDFEAEVDPKLSSARAMKNLVREFTVRMDFAYIYDSRDELDVGIAFNIIKTKLFLMNKIGTFTDVTDLGGNISFYLKYKLLRYDNFGLDFGTRYNFASLTRKGNFTFEPRVNLTYRLIPELALKSSWGLYEQSLTTITDENDVVSLFEPWFIFPDYLNSARAIHYNFGIDFDPLAWLSFSIESYYKRLFNVPVINTQKNIVNQRDLVPSDGEAYGTEILMQIKKNPILFTTSYSLSKAFQTVDGDKFPPKYDTRHNFKSIIEINLGYGLQTSLAWNFHTGNPFTPSAGYYDKLFIDNLNIQEFYTSYYPFTLLGERNSYRLPTYHRLDFSLSKKFMIRFVNFTCDFSVLNIYDRKNLFYFDRDTGEKVNMLPLLISGTIKLEI
ncbi:MAG: hypothetical protein CVV23_16275 [Ignavibacteriae bacterium HGW-Ignavibacteriae-2]|nr:MAG: hypothetical protein CVV23_16275 [Ignavibacteriae bacterium HGW-Ignavibacteriae-2]